MLPIVKFTKCGATPLSAAKKGYSTDSSICGAFTEQRSDHPSENPAIMQEDHDNE